MAALQDLTKKALLIQLITKVDAMSAELDTLKADFANLVAAVASLKTVADANAGLAAAAIAKLEELAAAVAAQAADNAALADLDTQAKQAVSDLQADAAEVSASNTAVQAELDKLNPPPTP